MYSWEGGIPKTPKITFLTAEHGKEGEVVQAVIGKAKELGMRMLVVEIPQKENEAMEEAMAEIGFASSRAIKGAYGPYGSYGIKDKEGDIDQLIFAREIKNSWTPSSPLFTEVNK
jgi:hypothetical protein